MALDSNVKEKISIEVIKTLVTRFENFPEDASKNRNAPFHESFLKAFSDKLNGKVSDTPFFISLSSWLQGLNTTLGQTFFENVAHHLSNGEKREYTSKKLGNIKIHSAQRKYISTLIAELSAGRYLPNNIAEDKEIYKKIEEIEEDIIDSMDFSADVLFEDDDSITAIELKSVKPNSGEMRGEKQKILEGKSALSRLFPEKKIRFFLGFPFDPTVNPENESVTSFNKQRFIDSVINLNKYFHRDEILIANELWNLLSGQEETMESILDIINCISTTSFLQKFQLLVDNSKRTTNAYRQQLSEWNLVSELELVDNNAALLPKIRGNTTLTRIYNKTAFDGQGNYNIARYNVLKKLI
jgi:hypothetical protein